MCCVCLSSTAPTRDRGTSQQGTAGIIRAHRHLFPRWAECVCVAAVNQHDSHRLVAEGSPPPHSLESMQPPRHSREQTIQASDPSRRGHTACRATAASFWQRFLAGVTCSRHLPEDAATASDSAHSCGKAQVSDTGSASAGASPALPRPLSCTVFYQVRHCDGYFISCGALYLVPSCCLRVAPAAMPRPRTLAAPLLPNTRRARRLCQA